MKFVRNQNGKKWYENKGKMHIIEQTRAINGDSKWYASKFAINLQVYML